MKATYLIEKPTWGARLFYRFFPELQLQSTNWLQLWEQRRRHESTKFIRFSCLCAIIGYPLHIYIDQMLALEPVWLWLTYRLGLAGFALLILLWTFSSYYEKSRFYKLPYIMAVLLASYFQAKSMTWSDQISIFFAFVIPCIGIWGLQSNAGNSLLLLVIIFACQYDSIEQYTVSQPEGFFYSYLLSSYILAFLLVMFSRSSMHIKVASFVAERQLDEERAKVANAQIELMNQLKSFVPREIFSRIMKYKAEHKAATLLEAIDEVLRIREKKIACLWSDIRNFTESCKLEQYIEKSAVPNIQRCTNLVESQKGVPRLIGDLVLAYWDQDHAIHLCLRTAFLLMEKHHKQNLETLEHLQVRRFIILSWGDAFVGNIGGVDSSREITCLGSTVNLLSRIDLVTKEEGFVNHIPEMSIIMTDSFASEIIRLCPDLSLKKIDLRRLAIKINNFPDEKQLWIMEDNPQNRRIILSEQFEMIELGSYEGTQHSEFYCTAS